MVLTLDDIDLHYDVHGDGEPLLWLHGGLGLGSDWQYVFGTAPARYTLIAPDLRGHGRSTGAGPVYSFKQAARDAFALLDHLQIDRVKIVGLSGGGISALHMATIDPARITAMIVVSAPPRFPEQARAIQRAYSDALLGDEQTARMRERHPRAGQFATLLAQVRAMADAGDPNFTRDELATITACTLIVFGDRDPLYPVRIAVELREAIPHSWLWVIPNGGHGPVFGPDAPRFVEAALTFLAGGYK